MKKLNIMFLIIITFTFSSCDMLFDLLGGSSESTNKYTIQSETIDPNAFCYLIKMNSSEEIIKAENTGYISRSADVVNNLPQNNSYNETDAFIIELNSQISNCVDNTSYRSSVNSNYTSTDTVKLSYQENLSTKNFYSYTRIEEDEEGNTVEISEEIKAKCKYRGAYCYVFADENNSFLLQKGINLSDDDYKKLGQKFDSCYEKEIVINGNPFYEKYNNFYFVPCNDKIIILVSDLFGDASPEQDGGTVGYFYNGDLFNQNYVNTYYNNVNSNECEMFYIDALFLTKRPDTVYSTLVHEFNHMINYVIKTVNYMTKYPNAKTVRKCDVWFTEMLSMTTEDMLQKYLSIPDLDAPKARLIYFNNCYYYGFKLWNYERNQNWTKTEKQLYQSSMYANTYAFGAFLVRNFGGIELLKEIAQNEYIDETSITMALRKIYPNYTYNIKQEIKYIDFDYVLSKFSECLFNTSKPTEKQLAKTGEKQYFSLNRATDANNPENLAFDAINDFKYPDENYNPITATINPITYNNNEAVDLYPYGFSIHRIGKIQSDCTLNKNPKLDYYLRQVK